MKQIAQKNGAASLIEAITGTRAKGVKIPPPANQQRETFCGEAEPEKHDILVEKLTWDAKDLARNFIESGRRLADPPKSIAKDDAGAS